MISRWLTFTLVSTWAYVAVSFLAVLVPQRISCIDWPRRVNEVLIYWSRENVKRTSYTYEKEWVASLCRKKKGTSNACIQRRTKGIEGERKRLVRIRTGFAASTRTRERVAAYVINVSSTHENIWEEGVSSIPMYVLAHFSATLYFRSNSMIF